MGKDANPFISPSDLMISLVRCCGVVAKNLEILELLGFKDVNLAKYLRYLASSYLPGNYL